MFDIATFFKRGKADSSEVAKDRLKLVLIHDRMNTSPELLECIRKDIMKVLSKYMDTDSEDLDISVTKSTDGENSPVLYANIPLKDIKRYAN